MKQFLLPLISIFAMINFQLPSVTLGQGLSTALNEAQKALNDAESLAQQGRYREARNLYLQAIRLNPHFIKAFEQYSLFLYTKSRFKEGARAMSIGLKLNPGNTALQGHLGIHLFRMGQILRAHNIMKGVVDGLKDRFEIQAVFSQCAMMLEDYQGTIQAIKNYFIYRPISLRNRDNAFRVQSAIAYLRLGMINQGEKELDWVIKSGAVTIPTQLALAEVKLRRGKCSEALTAYQHLMAKTKRKDLILYIGEAYKCMRRFQDAINVANIYLSEKRGIINGLLADPKQREQYYFMIAHIRQALMLRGNSALELNQFQRALEDYQKVEIFTGATEKIAIRIAQAFFYLQRYSEALAKLEPHLKQSATRPAALVLALRAAVRAEKKQLAISYANRLINLPDAASEHYYFAGIAYSSAGQFVKAIDLYKRALAGNTRHAGAREELVRAYSFLANAAMKKKEYELALSLMKNALNYDTYSGLVNQNLALLYLIMNQPGKALNFAAEAVRLLPNSLVANHLLGRALALTGKIKEALTRYQKIASLSRTSADLTCLGRILTEMAIFKIANGLSEKGFSDLEQAYKLTSRNSRDVELSKIIQRNMVWGHFLRGNELLERGATAQAVKELHWASSKMAILSKDAQNVLRTSYILAVIHNGEYVLARQLIESGKRNLAQALQPGFNDFGYELLSVYLDYSANSGSISGSAMANLEKLMNQAPATLADWMKELILNAYSQIALKNYIRGKNPLALDAFRKYRQIIKNIPPKIRHNMAVAEYSGGRREEAIRSFQEIADKVPLGYCNLAVHYEVHGDMAKAYNLFNQCEQRGVKFTNLKGILSVKKQIFEK